MGMLLIGIACSSAAADLLWQLGWVKGQLQKKAPARLPQLRACIACSGPKCPGLGWLQPCLCVTFFCREKSVLLVVKLSLVTC